MIIPKAVIDAIAKYYEHRKAQSDLIPWDKDADIDRIFEATKAAGYSAEASCGTFWLDNGIERTRITEKNYLIGGEVTNADGTPFGCIAELANTLSKTKKD